MLRPVVLVFVAIWFAPVPPPAAAAPVDPWAGLHGEMWDVNEVWSLSRAQAAIAGAAPTAQFRATLFDYPSGQNTLASNKRLSEFLSHDAASLTGPDRTMTTSVLRFSGFIDIAPGAHKLKVESDDGFGLWIAGAQVAAHENQRSFGATETAFSVAEGGRLPFELLFFENRGVTGLRVALDGSTLGAERLSTQPAAIPLPGTAVLLLGALASLALWRRRIAA
ncbi:MAG: hypothetical protein EA355_10865 [Rhodobacteraceae bacterium]|nr:MAG: hypothetical protein EA355_10865 [Paracoccaceae bacterium]